MNTLADFWLVVVLFANSKSCSLPTCLSVHLFVEDHLEKSSRSLSLALMPSVSDRSLVLFRSSGSLSTMD